MVQQNPSVTALKPVLHIQAILDASQTAHEVRTAPPGRRFQLMTQGKAQCFLLHKGSCIISRADDALVISTIASPNITGVNDLIPPEANVLIVASTDIEYSLIPLDTFLAFIEEHQLWKQVSYLLMFYSSRLYEHQRTNAGLSTYKIITHLLQTLSNEDFDVRAMTTAVEYIQERTFLSRSGIMKMLSELKAGGYIVLSRGLLIKINKLPDKF